MPDCCTRLTHLELTALRGNVSVRCSHCGRLFWRREESLRNGHGAGRVSRCGRSFGDLGPGRSQHRCVFDEAGLRGIGHCFLALCSACSSRGCPLVGRRRSICPRDFRNPVFYHWRESAGHARQSESIRVVDNLSAFGSDGLHLEEAVRYCQQQFRRPFRCRTY